MKEIRFVLKFSFSNYFQSLDILKITMIVSEESYQNLSNYIKFLFKRRIEMNKNRINSSEKIEIEVIISMSMLLVLRRGYLIQCAILNYMV